MRILITAPPKAGNMWLKCLLGAIYNLRWLKGSETPEKPELNRFVAWANAGHFADETIFHQHYDYSETLCDAAAAIPAHLVTIVRDPYDAFVSTYFTLQQHAETGNLKRRRLDVLMDKPLDHPDVFDFLAAGGYENQLSKATEWLHSQRAVPLRYEDLHRDPVATLTRATDQIAPADPDRIARAIEACNAEAMRKRSEGMARHVRSVTVGDSANHLDERHFAIFRERYGDYVRRLGYPVR